ncbi:MAG: helix-turn-helix domain-containing protein, partial [Chloroflexi bacterium]|nr:helix-turn-helix domain-containing protein [Chloroflexota bacterium]
VGLSPTTLRQAIRSGELPCSRIGSRVILMRDDLMFWLRSKRA